MEKIFQILAVVLAGVAAYFLWTRNGDGAFITAVLASVSFFLSVRFQIKERLKQRAAEREEEEKGRRGEEEISNSSAGSVSLPGIPQTFDDQLTTADNSPATDKEQI